MPKRYTSNEQGEEEFSEATGNGTVALTSYEFRGVADRSYESTQHYSKLKVRIFGTPRPMYRHHGRLINGRFQPYNPSLPNVLSLRQALKAAIDSCYDKKENKALFNSTPGNNWPVALKIKFFFKRPKKHYLQQSDGLHVKPNADVYVTKKPDTDNLAKLIMDALEGIIYKNDCVVSSVAASKQWLFHHSTKPIQENAPEANECTLIEITQYKPGTYDSACDCASCSQLKRKSH